MPISPDQNSQPHPNLRVLPGGKQEGETTQDPRRASRFGSYLAPLGLGATVAVLALKSAQGLPLPSFTGLFNGSQTPNSKVPTLGAVERGAGGLNQGTPTLTFEQVKKWPSQETVTVTRDQARDGESGIVAAIDNEVLAGPESNPATARALINQVKSQEIADGVREGDSFTVANIHPNTPNAVIGGNDNIPAK
jgi:hypothetical protein